MKKWLIIQSILFAIIGMALVYLTFSKVPLNDVFQVIEKGNFYVLIPVLFVSVLVLIIRVWRWKILYEHSGISVKSSSLFYALNIGYLVNFAVPRLGEISRALVLKKSDQLEINRSLSTIVFERMADILALMLVVITAFLLEFTHKNGIFNHFTKDFNIGDGSKLILLSGIFIIGFILLGFIYYFRIKFGKWFSDLVEHFVHLFSMQQKWKFILSTLLIWFGFYLMTYLWVFMFPSSSGLGMYSCFQVMVLGVIARTLPIQAGSAGAYHYVVSTAFILLGTDQATSGALAIVIHGFQSILTLLIGIISYICFLYFGAKK